MQLTPVIFSVSLEFKSRSLDGSSEFTRWQFNSPRLPIALTALAFLHSEI
jgi:hypothetical protein